MPKKLALDIEETLELIAMHGTHMVSSCTCANCAMPIKAEMLAKIDRMRELVLSLPEHDHLEVEFEPERTAH